MWRTLYFGQLAGQYNYLEYLFIFKQIVVALLNISSLKAGEKNQSHTF